MKCSICLIGPELVFNPELILNPLTVVWVSLNAVYFGWNVASIVSFDLIVGVATKVRSCTYSSAFGGFCTVCRVLLSDEWGMNVFHPTWKHCQVDCQGKSLMKMTCRNDYVKSLSYLVQGFVWRLHGVMIILLLILANVENKIHQLFREIT